MKIEILKKCFVGTGGNLRPGDKLEVADNVAVRLVSGGLAKEVKRGGRPKKMELDNRAFDVDELEIPEAE
jgi:hypothetical protein